MSGLLRLGVNPNGGRDFVVGDIHGMFSLLEAMLEALGFDDSVDRLISVGDLVDRGPESEHALRWLNKPWFFCVRGNHEQLCLYNDVSFEAKSCHLMNGGLWFEGLSTTEREDFKAAFNALPWAIEFEANGIRFGVVHAEVPGNVWDEELFNEGCEHTLTWSRHRIRSKNHEEVKGIDIVLVGHTVVSHPVAYGNVVYIDTGSCFPDAFGLTIFSPTDNKLYNLRAEDNILRSTDMEITDETA